LNPKNGTDRGGTAAKIRRQDVPRQIGILGRGANEQRKKRFNLQSRRIRRAASEPPRIGGVRKEPERWRGRGGGAWNVVPYCKRKKVLGLSFGGDTQRFNCGSESYAILSKRGVERDKLAFVFIEKKKLRRDKATPEIGKISKDWERKP